CQGAEAPALERAPRTAGDRARSRSRRRRRRALATARRAAARPPRERRAADPPAPPAAARLAAERRDPRPGQRAAGRRLTDAIVDPPGGEREQYERDAAEQRGFDSLEEPEPARRLIHRVRVVPDQLDDAVRVELARARPASHDVRRDGVPE